MGNSSVQKLRPKKDRELTPAAFRQLLDWLEEGVRSEGRAYLEMRRRLVAYFDRKNCSAPDDLADETLNRVARRLEEEGAIESQSPARYCYIVARFVFMENLRAVEKDELTRGELRRVQGPSDHDDAEMRERMMECLDQCAARLEPANRELILRYYVGKERAKIENRRALAHSLGITVNALSIRACRIRDKLEGCVRNCVDG